MIDPIIYEPTTDMMFVTVRHVLLDGGEDVAEGLVAHIGIDGLPAAYEIEDASQHPEHIVFVLEQLRATQQQRAA